MIKEFTAVSNSTIYDVCLNTYGSLNYLGKLMDDNDHPGADVYPTSGQVFEYDANLVQRPASGSYNSALAGGASLVKYATQPE